MSAFLTGLISNELMLTKGILAVVVLFVFVCIKIDYIVLRKIL